MPQDKPTTCLQLVTPHIAQRRNNKEHSKARQNQTSSITIFHQNVRGLRKKIERLNHLLIDLKPTILILTEHGLSAEKLALTKISGYNLITHFCRKEHKLGGVAIYIQKATNIKAEEIDVSNKSIEMIFETAATKIKVKNKTVYLLGIYRPPGGQARLAVDILTETLAFFQADAKEFVLMGDINIDRLTENPDNSYLEDELQTFGIRRLPLPATRTTSYSKTSIDCICTNAKEDATVFTVVRAGISDHTGQTLAVKLENNTSERASMQKRIFSKKNLDSLKYELSTENWHWVHNAPDAEEAYHTFLTTVRRTLDYACPYKTVRAKEKRRKYKYDEDAKILKDDFLAALHRHELTGNEDDKKLMVEKKKTYDLKLRDLKRNFTAEYIINADNKSKAVWEIINKEKQCKQKEEPNLQLEIHGNIVHNPAEIVEHLNQYFVNIADSTLENNRNELKHKTITHPMIFPHSTIQPLHLTPTTNEEVLKIIASLKPKLSCGLDEVPPKAVKHCAIQLAPPLVSIVNKSFSLGQFPSALKIAKVYPKHKKGQHTKQENYRPISLISTFSKIIEKIALSRMLAHLEIHNLMARNQHGFIKGRSTTTALTTLIEQTIDHLEERRHVSAVLLDYSKAFDCLGHDLILRKLSTLGIEGLAKDWVASYLNGRSQILEIQNHTNGRKSAYRSTQLAVNRGVPQGSVLGPFLFLLFTNDFSNFISHKNVETIMYADDTTLLFANNTPQGLLSDILSSTDKALQYCLQNDLAINPSKTTQINFSKKQEEIPEIPGISVEKNTKLLGLTIDADLSWNEHIHYLTKKLSSGIYTVRRMMWIGGLETAKTAYYAAVESHIRYGLISWGGTSEGNLKTILTLQKKAIRILYGLNSMDSCRDAFRALKLLTVPALYINAVVIYTKELDLPRNEDIHSYHTRRAADYSLPTHHTTRFSKKPSYIGRKLINSLPNFIKTATGNKMKQSLWNWLVEHPVYSIEEFFQLQ